MVERLLAKEKVEGSSPFRRSKKKLQVASDKLQVIAAHSLGAWYLDLATFFCKLPSGVMVTRLTLDQRDSRFES